MTAPGMVIAGRYRLTYRLAVGGMGSVWEAWDQLLLRPVAVKQILVGPAWTGQDTAEAAQRIVREARLAARVHHAHAVTVYDVVDEGGRPCLIMQLVRSRSLSSLITAQGQLDQPFVARIGAQLASALAAAHRVGVIHRDVKPGNVLITDDGSAMVTDFGIAHGIGDATLTAHGMLSGTPAYLAPEVARGAPSSVASDVFSLGSTLYAALEGAPPFGTDANPMVLLHRVAVGEFPAAERAGPLSPVLARMLALDPAERPAMIEIFRQLTDIFPAAARSAENATAPVPTARPTAQPTEDSPQIAPEPAATPPEPSSPISRLQSWVQVSRPDQTGLTTLGGASELAAPPNRRRRRRLQAAAVMVLVVVAIVIAALTAPWSARSRTAQSPLPSDPGPTSETSLPQSAAGGAPMVASKRAAPGSTTLASPVAGASAATPSAQPNPSPSTASGPSVGSSTVPSVAGTQPETRAASTSPSRPPPPGSVSVAAGPSSRPAATTTTSSSSPSASQLVDAVVTYYATLPNDTDTDWTRLTSRFQNGIAQDRSYYQRFWDGISKVLARDVQATPPDTVQATITYFFRDGRIVTERTAYQMLSENGIIKIDNSTVLSSQTQ